MENLCSRTLNQVDYILSPFPCLFPCTVCFHAVTFLRGLLLKDLLSFSVLKNHYVSLCKTLRVGSAGEVCIPNVPNASISQRCCKTCSYCWDDFTRYNLQWKLELFDWWPWSTCYLDIVALMAVEHWKYLNGVLTNPNPSVIVLYISHNIKPLFRNEKKKKTTFNLFTLFLHFLLLLSDSRQTVKKSISCLHTPPFSSSTCKLM